MNGVGFEIRFVGLFTCKRFVEFICITVAVTDGIVESTFSDVA